MVKEKKEVVGLMKEVSGYGNNQKTKTKTQKEKQLIY